jgi:hypothetical protein
MAPPLEALAALLGGDVAALRSSPVLAAGLGALLLVALLLVVYAARVLLRSARRDAVLLVGPCGAGKTALFSLVRLRLRLRLCAATAVASGASSFSGPVPSPQRARRLCRVAVAARALRSCATAACTAAA